MYLHLINLLFRSKDEMIELVSEEEFYKEAPESVSRAVSKQKNEKFDSFENSSLTVDEVLQLKFRKSQRFVNNFK